MAIMLPQIQPIGLSPVPYQRLDYSPLFQGPGIMGGLRQGLQQGRQNAALKQQMEMQKQQMEQQAEENRIKGIVTTAAELQGLPVDEQQRRLKARALQLQENGQDYELETEALYMLHNDPAAFEETLNGTIEFGQRMGYLKPTVAETRQAGLNKNKLQFGATGVIKDSQNNMYYTSQVRDPSSGLAKTVYSPIGQAPAEPVGKVNFVTTLGQTSEEKTLDDATRAKLIEQYKIEAQTGGAAGKIAAENLGALRGDIQTEETQAYRQAVKTEPFLNALQAALNAADTGKFAQAKTILGQYLPGIDVADEQNFEAMAVELAINQLMKFSGPTTDFEFLKSTLTTLQSGKTKEANQMLLNRLKSDNEKAKNRYQNFKEFKNERGDFEEFDSWYLERQEQVAPQGSATGIPDGQTANGGELTARGGKWYRTDALANIPQKTITLDTKQKPTQAGIETETTETVTSEDPLVGTAAPNIPDGVTGSNGKYIVKNGVWVLNTPDTKRNTRKSRVGTRGGLLGGE